MSRLGELILNRFFPLPSSAMDGSAFLGKSKLKVLFGADFFSTISGKEVLDFGCGEGDEAIEMSRYAKRVVGLDNRESVMAKGRARSSKVEFATTTAEKFDVIVSLDCFEHFADPAGVLKYMSSLLKPAGQILISFGPTWYHPLGGHLFSVFPWAHLIFSEKSLCRWRARFKTDGATKFCEVSGGLNQMSISRFVKVVSQSPFQFHSFECVPIHRLAFLHNRLTRELTTSIVRCSLIPRVA